VVTPVLRGQLACQHTQQQVTADGWKHETPTACPRTQHQGPQRDKVGAANHDGVTYRRHAAPPGGCASSPHERRSGVHQTSQHNAQGEKIGKVKHE